MLKPFVFVFIIAKVVNSTPFFDDVKMYGCRCLLKDNTQRILNSLTAAIPINSNQPILNMDMRPREQSFTSNLQNKIHFLQKWLSTLTLNTHSDKPTTTTPPPTPPPSSAEDILSIPFDTDGTRNSVFMRLAQKVVTKYLKKLSGEWTILDKFECVCDGNLVDLLKSKTFINIQIAHD